METIFKTDKNGNQRYTSIRVQKLKDGTANIIKATGVVDGKESISTTHVPLGYESALKRAKTIWKNLQTPDVMPMLANKWDDRKKYIRNRSTSNRNLTGFDYSSRIKVGFRVRENSFLEPSISVKVLRMVSTSTVSVTIQTKRLRKLRVCLKPTRNNSSFTFLIIST